MERTLRGQIAWAMRKFLRISREVEAFNRGGEIMKSNTAGIIYDMQIQN